MCRSSDRRDSLWGRGGKKLHALLGLNLLVRPWFWVAAILLWGAWLFAPCLLGFERLAFRDVSHFYLPLYGLLGERLASGDLPLWNPWDRFGIPVAGETTTAIFYPPRLLFACVPADYAMTLYAVGHLLVAGSGAYWVARGASCHGWLSPREAVAGRSRDRADRLAPFAAAVIYPAAGPVFFLYTNPPFLVGAAWLPWALGGLLRAVHRPSLGTITIASLGLALAILGGDPQTAFHAVLFSGLYWATLRARAYGKLPSLRSGAVVPKPRLLPLLVCVLLAAGLASLQILPGAAWSLESWRRGSAPPSVYSRVVSAFDSPAAPAEAPGAMGAAPIRGAGGRHASDVYDYSVAPWHWAELASPFLAGRLFPVNGRLAQLIPGEPRIWTLTLYAGLLPLVCLLAGPLAPRRWTVWHGLVAAGLLLSLGEFGVGRLVRVCLEAVGLEMPAELSDATGGGYWWLVTFIPGYGQFRYPAKWLPFAALGMAVWTAVCLSHRRGHTWRRGGRIAWGIGLAAVAILVFSWLPAFRVFLTDRVATGDFADTFWGPLDLSTGLHSLRWSLSLTAVLAAGYGWVLRSQEQRKPASSFSAIAISPRLARSRIVALSLAILLVDLGLSVSWQLATVPPAQTARDHAAAAEFERQAPPQRYLSLATSRDWPPQWRRTHSADRLREVEAAQRELWFIRWHLADSAAVANSAVSIASLRSTLFWREARQFALALSPPERERFVNSLHRFIGIAATVDRRATTDASTAEQRQADLPFHLHFSPINDPMPLVRWQSAWRVGDAGPKGIDPVERMRGDLQTLFAEVLEREGAVIPRIENGSLAVEPAAGEARSQALTDSGAVTLLSWQPERLRILVDAPAAGLVTVQQLQDGFWNARIRPAPRITGQAAANGSATLGELRWENQEVHRVDVIAQGVFVPQGRHVVELYYRPTWLSWGIFLTASTFAGLVLCGYRTRAKASEKKKSFNGKPQATAF